MIDTLEQREEDLKQTLVAGFCGNHLPEVSCSIASWTHLSVATPAEPRGEKKLFLVQILGGEKLLKFVESAGEKLLSGLRGAKKTRFGSFFGSFFAFFKPLFVSKYFCFGGSFVLQACRRENIWMFLFSQRAVE